MNAIIVTSALEYVELSTVLAVFVIIACALLSYQISARRPLYYNLFVVEMHTWATRRMVQVLHLGQEFQAPVPWDRLVQRMRARAPRVQGEQRLAISDTNIVIQSPNTVIDSPAPARSPDVDLITLWDIEMPPPASGDAPDSVRDSHHAAAAAIAILARGDDVSLMSRRFRNQERTSGDRDGLIPQFDIGRSSSGRHEYVTTDVTYTRPSIANVPHQFIARASNSTEAPSPLVFSDHVENHLEENEDEDDNENENDSSSESTSSDSEEVEEGEPAAPVEQESEQEAVAESNTDSGVIAERESECPVIAGSSEGKVLIRLKFLNDTEKDTYALLDDTVAKFKGEHFHNLANKVVRLIFQGQLLRDDHRTLEDYGLQPGSIVHCHISSTPLTRPAVQDLNPIVHNPHRRQHRRSPRIPSMDAQIGELLRRDLERRSAVQDRNVGQIYIMLSSMVPLFSGIGIAFFRPDRIRDFLRPATLMMISRWICTFLVDNGLLDDEGDFESTLQTSTLFWIFGGQMLAVSIFFYYFPDVFDRVGFSIFVIVFLYFVFVIYSRQRRRRPESESQNESLENHIVQENIRLL